MNVNAESDAQFLDVREYEVRKYDGQVICVVQALGPEAAVQIAAQMGYVWAKLGDGTHAVPVEQA